MSQFTADMPLKDLAIWLGKYAGVTLTCMAKIEEDTARALAKMAHSSASQLGKCLHETAQTKDCPDHQKQWLLESTKLDSELLVIALTNQPSVTTSSTIAPPPCDNEGGPTETRPAPAPYSDSDVLMGNIDDLVTDDLYQYGCQRVGLSLEGEGVSSVEYLHMALKAMYLNTMQCSLKMLYIH